MVNSRLDADPAPIEIEFSPQLHDRRIPVEVFDRGALMKRIAGREVASRQRVGFHQLIVCTEGTGVHHIDFEPVELSTGTIVRIYPGQVQQFQQDSLFEASLVIWPAEFDNPEPNEPRWFPGSQMRTNWRLDPEPFSRVVKTVDDLREEQGRFAGTDRQVKLMQLQLSTLLVRVADELTDATRERGTLPRPYIAYREAIEQQLYQRPSVGEIAHSIGYSTRTLDRSCGAVSEQTAKQVLDERVAFEMRRLLVYTARPISRIRLDFGFNDASNFSRFVKRHLGQTAGELRKSQ